jgi:2'-5' RNA ligase
MNKEGYCNYFIAIVPPEPIYSEALFLKNYFRDNFNSKGSLNSSPHITLHMPFEWKESKENVLIEKLAAFVQEFSSFSIVLKDFKCFEPRVIFMGVDKTKELEVFQKELERFCKRTFQLFNAQYQDLPYHPHITLAFRDLRKPMFYKAWEEFKNKGYDATFLADRIALLKHDGKRWNTFHEFLLA